MPDKIFLLPDEGALVAECMDDTSSSMHEPIDVSAPRHTVPPAVVLSWDPNHGGDLTQLEPVHAICRQALQAWTGDLGDLGEAAHG